MELDISAAYDSEAGVEQLTRSFSLRADGLSLTDEGRLRTAQTVTWIFLLRDRPAWENGRITAGQLVIRCPEGLAFTAEEKPVTDTRMARNWPGSLWRVMLKGSPGNHFRTTFVFSAKDREA